MPQTEIRGIVLAGGTGGRLYPLTKVTNKHLLPVGKLPMIYYPIKKLIEAGIKNILVVSGTEHLGNVVASLGSGKEFGCHFTYKVQDDAGGIAQALGLAEDFACHCKMVVILGDNIFSSSLLTYVDSYRHQTEGAKILIREVPDPQRFGVAELSGNRIVGIEEKPKKPKSPYCVTGVYFYPSDVFNIIKTLKPSRRGELEITDVNNYYIKQGTMTCNILEGMWTDAGTFESIRRASDYAFANDLV